MIMKLLRDPPSNLMLFQGIPSCST